MEKVGRPTPLFFRKELPSIYVGTYLHTHRWVRRYPTDSGGSGSDSSAGGDDAATQKDTENADAADTGPTAIAAICSICYLRARLYVSSRPRPRPSSKDSGDASMRCNEMSHHIHWVTDPRKDEATDSSDASGNAQAATVVGFRLQRSRCCRCDLEVTVELNEPRVPLATIQLMERNRRKGLEHHPVQVIRNMRMAVSAIITLGRNALKGDKRLVNTQSEKPRARLGFDNGCNSCLRILGFKLVDTVFYPPDESEALRHVPEVLDQLKVVVSGLESRLPESERQNKYPVRPVLGDWLELVGGDTLPVQPGYEQRVVPMDEATKPVSPSYEVLRIDPRVTDEAVIWAYEKLAMEDEAAIPKFLNALLDLGKGRPSAKIQDKYQLEIDSGRLSQQMIDLAYAHFGTSDKSISDTFLVQLFDIACQERPTMVESHRDALRTIGKARNKLWLQELADHADAAMALGQEGEVTVPHTLTGTGAKTAAANLPAGLDNIGNTCYLNSLLQYYHTIRPLRKRLSRFGDRRTWNESLVPGRKDGMRLLSSDEISRSVRFVQLLSELFDKLSFATCDKSKKQRKSVRPSYDLAIMAFGGEEAAGITRPRSARIKNATARTRKKQSKSTVAPASQPPGLDPSLAEAKKTAVETESDTESVATGASGPQAAAVVGEGSDATSSNQQQQQTLSSGATATTEGEQIKPATVPPKSSTATSSASANRRITFMPQQDITECMNICMGYIEHALPPTSPAQPEDGDSGATQEENLYLPHHLFFGKLRHRLVRSDAQQDNRRAAAAADRGKVEAFHHLIITMSNSGNDIDECLDRLFEPTQVDLVEPTSSQPVAAKGGEGTPDPAEAPGGRSSGHRLEDAMDIEEDVRNNDIKGSQEQQQQQSFDDRGSAKEAEVVESGGEAPMTKVQRQQQKQQAATAKVYHSVDELPPFLQIQVQRVQFDKASARTYKSNAPLTLRPIISMARFMTPKSLMVPDTPLPDSSARAADDSAVSIPPNSVADKLYELRHEKEKEVHMLSRIRNLKRGDDAIGGGQGQWSLDEMLTLSQNALNRATEWLSSTPADKREVVCEGRIDAEDIKSCGAELEKLRVCLDERGKELEDEIKAKAQKLRSYYVSQLPPEFSTAYSQLDAIIRASNTGGDGSGNSNCAVAEESQDSNDGEQAASRPKSTNTGPDAVAATTVGSMTVDWPPFDCPSAVADPTLYALHAVFIHQGEADWGHYWCYVCDHERQRWIRYNDSNVNEVPETEIYRDTSGSNANAYSVVYVRYSEIPRLVQIC